MQSLVKPPNALVSAIITGDAKTSNSVSTSMLKSGIKPDTVINKHIIKALEIVGDRYEKGLFFVPDLLRSADAAKAALSIVKRFMPQKRSDHKILLATVKGDIHDIGKNIAAMVFESAGFCVIDLGKNVSAEKIVQAVKKYHPCVVGLSALLTTTMPEMAHVIKELDKNKCNVKVIIGGPNVTASYAKQIGAYGSARSALEGLGLVRNVIKKK